MRREHLEEFQPVCLVCSDTESISYPIQLEVTLKEFDQHVLEGVLRCSNPACQFEYPVIDGIPILVPNTREFISASANWLMFREDLDPVTLSLIRDCEGAEGSVNQMHQLLSTYGWCHYGDLDPAIDDPGCRLDFETLERAGRNGIFDDRRSSGLRLFSRQNDI